MFSISRVLSWLKTKAALLSLYEKLQTILLIVGVLSLVFIFLQTRAMNEQSRLAIENMQASMYAAIATQTTEMDRIFVEHPELRPYFYDKQTIIGIDKKTYDQVMAVAEHQLDTLDAIMTQLGYIPDDEDKTEDRNTWDNYFADSFANSPALCARINKNRSWYMKKLLDVADRNCQYHFTR